jgi:hypothetical protein
LYWSKEGYRGSKNVWEYYFEPVSDFDPKLVDLNAVEILSWSWYSPPDENGNGIGIYQGDSKWNDCPPLFYRKYVNQFILKYVRLKEYIETQVNDFFTENMSGELVCGVHVRRTDSVADIYKRTPPLNQYIKEINRYITYI